MKIGSASGAVTLSLAIVLLMMSHNPDPSRAKLPQPSKPPPLKPETALQATVTDVRLPPPPTSISPTVTQPAPNAPSAPKPMRLKRRPPVPPKPLAAVTPLKPQQRPILKSTPEQASPPQQEAKPSPVPDTPVTPQSRKEGRALLRMLEAGKGPVIEIAWPATKAARTRLYDLLVRCHGMQTALLSDDRKLYASDGAPGEIWQVNRDAVSGFVRQPSGVLTNAEHDVVGGIKRRHGRHFGRPVRLFPRSVDAALLGGLRQIIGKSYTSHETIRARYVLSGSRISIVDIRTDGTKRAGTIVLPGSRRCG